jgi:hypothetical protein
MSYPPVRYRGAHGEVSGTFRPASREIYFEALAEIRRSGRTLTEVEWTGFYARHDQYMV